jgi:hypothetical protein
LLQAPLGRPRGFPVRMPIIFPLFAQFCPIK